jgi:hypothetical protein
MFAIGERLLHSQKLLLANKYTWRPYREIIVKDPKRRIVMAAPFMDRVIHTAIHRVLEPLLDRYLTRSVYACRKGYGNKKAAIDLMAELRYLGSDRFVIKLDIQKYFDSIQHQILLENIMAKLLDPSLSHLLHSLLKSEPTFAARGYGIPIGNLSSQLFANFYLASADYLAIKAQPDVFYLRYMDDMVLGGKDKKKVLDLADALGHHVTTSLKLRMPFHKKMPIGNAPVPFLGYVIDHTGYRVLARNYRRHTKRIRKLQNKGVAPSELAKREISFEAFTRLV